MFSSTRFVALVCILQMALVIQRIAADTIQGTNQIALDVDNNSRFLQANTDLCRCEAYFEDFYIDRRRRLDDLNLFPYDYTDAFQDTDGYFVVEGIKVLDCRSGNTNNLRTVFDGTDGSDIERTSTTTTTTSLESIYTRLSVPKPAPAPTTLPTASPSTSPSVDLSTSSILSSLFRFGDILSNDLSSSSRSFGRDSSRTGGRYLTFLGGVVSDNREVVTTTSTKERQLMMGKGGSMMGKGGKGKGGGKGGGKGNYYVDDYTYEDDYAYYYDDGENYDDYYGKGGKGKGKGGKGGNGKGAYDDYYSGKVLFFLHFTFTQFESFLTTPFLSCF